MKMKFRGMTMAAMLLSASTVASGEQNNVTYDGDGNVTPVAYVGDVSSAAEDAYFAEDASYAMRASDDAKAAQAVRSVSHAEPQAPQLASTRQLARQQYAPVAASQLQPASYDMDGGSYYGSPMGGGYCDIGCDSGCDSRGGRSGGLADLMKCSNSPGWARAEFLMWFVQPVETPPLITTAPAGQFPDLTNPNTAVAFGGELDSDLSAGFRGDYGKWINDKIGIGGRFWIIDESSDSYSRQSNGTDISIGRPFFNTGLNQNDAVLVALNGQFAGSIRAESSIDMLAAEAYARINFISNSCCRTDLIGGYSYFQIDHLLTVDDTRQNFGTGQVRTFSDLGETENRFHGGQIGFESTITQGRWMAHALTKVHLGNMNQTQTSAGSRTDTLNGNAAAGMLVGLGESGTFENDEFSFIPELNMKLGYKFRNHVEFTVGYTFMYFDNVALVGDYINTNIDGAQFQVPFVDDNRLFSFQDTGMWVQGIDLGVSVTY